MIFGDVRKNSSPLQFISCKLQYYNVDTEASTLASSVMVENHIMKIAISTLKPTG